MNRPGQPPQRPPNLGPTQAFGGPLRAPFPPASAFGLPSRNPLQQQGFPGMPSARAAAGQSMVLPSPSFLQPRGQATAAGFPFGALPQQQQQPTQGQGQHTQHPQGQATSLLGQQLQQQQQQSQQQQSASSAVGGPPHLSSASLGTGQGNQAPSEAGLDPNDFPALGSGTATLNSANSPATTLASSYASQAGTGLTPGSGTNGQGGTGGSSQPREFTADDFPALGGQPNSTAQSSQNQTTGQDSSHPPGLNGFETRQTMPPGLLNLSVAQRGLASDADKRAGNAKVNNTWNGTTNAASSVQQNGSLQPGAQQLGAPPGVPPTFATQPQAQQQASYGAVTDGALGSTAAPNAGASAAVAPGAAPQTPAQQILISAADRWGLLGLLNAIKNADADQNLLSIGTDLGTMGLDMQTQGSLFSTFITPWSDSSAAHTVEPDFHLPPCYNVNAPPPGPAKAQGFSEETLFYMFYAHPRDALQEVAAQELYQRNWRFNKELRLWLTKETTRPRSSKTIDNGAGEHGVFTYWDPDVWEKNTKELTVMYADLENKETPAFAGPTLQPTAQGQQLQAGAAPPSVSPVAQLAQRSQVVRGNYPGLSMAAAAM